MISIAVVIVCIVLVGCAGGEQIILPSPRSAAPEPAARGLRAGFGRAEITPPPGVPLSGSGPESAQSAGYRHRLYARTLVLEDRRGERIVLIVADLPLVSALLHRTVADSLHRHGLGADRLILSATHTHSGPGNYHEAAQYNQQGGSLPGYDSLMVEFLVRRFVQSIEEALGDLKPAKAAWGFTEVTGLTKNRSLEAFLQNDFPTYPFPAGMPPLDKLRRMDLDELHPDTLLTLQQAAVDRTWTMLRVDQCDLEWNECRPAGAFSIFAMHGTGYPSANRLLDGDLHAIIERRLEDHIDALPAHDRSDAFHLFANGSVGDVTSAATATTRCNPLLTLEPGFGPGGPRRPPPVEEWRYPHAETARCLDDARKAVNRIGDLLADRAIQLYDKLRSNLAEDLLIDRGFSTVRLDSLPAKPLCLEPTAGFSNAAGSTEDAPVRVEGWRVFGFIRTGLEEGGRAVDRARKHCDGAKKRLLGPLQSRVNGEYGFPKYAQFAVVRIGNTLLATVPGEPTTVAGLRIERAVSAAANHPGDRIAVVSHSNGYLQYVATPEEYRMQHYEGGSTLYGPNSSVVYADQFAALAAGLEDPIVDVTPIRGNPGRNRSYMVPPRNPPRASQVERTVVESDCRDNRFTATWIDLEPILLMPANGRLIEIQRLDPGTSDWKTVAWDDNRSVEIRVIKRKGKFRRVWEVRWMPDEGAAGSYAPHIPPGTYRLYVPARSYLGDMLEQAVGRAEYCP